MKKPTSKIRDEIARLQEQLKLAETREAERIGRIALKAGLGEVEIDESELQAAFEELAKRFRGGKARPNGGKGASNNGEGGTLSAQHPPGAAEGRTWRGLSECEDPRHPTPARRTHAKRLSSAALSSRRGCETRSARYCSGSSLMPPRD